MKTTHSRNATTNNAVLPSGRVVYVNGEYIAEAEAGISIYDSASFPLSLTMTAFANIYTREKHRIV